MKKLCILLITLVIIAGYAPAMKADAQETESPKDIVEVYPQKIDVHHPMVCRVNQLYYTLWDWGSDKTAEVIGATPDAPSVLQIPSNISVKGTIYAVTEFSPEDVELILGLPCGKQVFEEIKLPDSVVDISLYGGRFPNIRCKKINIPKHAEMQTDTKIDIDIDDIILVIPKDHDYYTLKDNFLYDKKDPTRIHCVLGASGHVRIPEGVRYVGSLLKNSKITQLSLPSTIEKIGLGFAFRVDKLKNLDLSATKLKIIPPDAFGETKNLQKIKLPSVLRRIDADAFQYSSLRKVVIPNKVTEIGSSAFADCPKLKKVTLGKKLKIIERSAFSCTALQEITIPESVKKISEFGIDSKSIRKIIFLHRKKLPEFQARWIGKHNRSGIKFYVINMKIAKQLKKQLRRKNSKVKKAKIYVGKKKKLVYKNINA